MVRGGEEMEPRRKIQREGSDGCVGYYVRNRTECIFLSLVQDSKAEHHMKLAAETWSIILW